MGVIALKCSQAPNYPEPLGNILDLSSLRLSRDQCRTNGLWGSLIMDSQQQASDWLQDFYTAMNAAPVWSGFVLKSIPYSEVSAVGNGALYIAPTAPGPVANLTESDFIGDSGSPLISVERKAQVDVPEPPAAADAEPGERLQHRRHVAAAGRSLCGWDVSPRRRTICDSTQRCG